MPTHKRRNFQTRLRNACDWFRHNEPISQAQRTHCREFLRIVARNPRFASEVQKLNSLEFEVMAIASTRAELEDEAPRFSAADVRKAIGLEIRQDRRAEVQQYLGNTRHTNEIGVSGTLSAYRTSTEQEMDSLVTNIKRDFDKKAIHYLRRKLACIENEEWHSIVCAPDNCRPTSTPDASAISAGGPAWFSSDVVPYCPLECCDANNLLHIIHAAGGVIPRSFGEPAWMWGEDGESISVGGPVPEIFLSEARYIAATAKLLEGGFLVTYNTEGALAINPETQSHHAGSTNSIWKLAALAAVCRAFPRWPNPKPSSAAQCKILMPLLAIVLSYLPQLQPIPLLKRSIAEVCISASYFGLLPWKDSMLRIAETCCEQGSSDLQDQLFLRKRMLKRLQSLPDISQQHQTRERASARSYGLFGEQIIFQASRLLDKDACVDDIRQQLGRFQPGSSTFERCIDLKGKGILARAYRNKGQFSKAHELYHQLIADYSHIDRVDPSNDFIASRAETTCEVGRPDAAIDYLNAEAHFHMPAKGSRLQLAMANALLMKCLIHFREEGIVDHQLITEAYYAFHRYQADSARHPHSDLTITLKSNRYAACAGMAMARHLQTFDASVSECREKCEKAKQEWENTRMTAQKCWSQPGFAEMVALLSLSDLEARLGSGLSHTLRLSAMQLKTGTGRQYHFVAQGSIWLDLIECRAPKDAIG